MWRCIIGLLQVLQSKLYKPGPADKSELKDGVKCETIQLPSVMIRSTFMFATFRMQCAVPLQRSAYWNLLIKAIFSFLFLCFVSPFIVLFFTNYLCWFLLHAKRSKDIYFFSIHWSTWGRKKWVSHSRILKFSLCNWNYELCSS